MAYISASFISAGKKTMRDGNKKYLIEFGKPNLANEWSEVSSPDNRKMMSAYREYFRLGKSEWIKLVKKGKLAKYTKTQTKAIENTEAAITNAFKKLDKLKQERAMNQILSGKVELSIVAKWSDGFKFLVAGNTRLVAQMEAFGEGCVWQFDVPDDGE